MISKFTTLCLLCSILSLTSSAQLAGTYTVPGSYATIAAAVTALNTVGMSNSVTINISAGHTETAPAGGIQLGSAVLNPTTNLRTLKFIKSGTGANPLINAQVGSGSGDGIFNLKGIDNVTIDGIDLRERAANTTAATGMEWGYALLNRANTAPFDGCRNNEILNCTVTLSRLYANSKGIFTGHNIAGNATPLAIASSADEHNQNRFYGNSITNAVNGIFLNGYNDPTQGLFDVGNQVGGSTPALGNKITNVIGGLVAASYGIYAAYQSSVSILNNNIDQLADGGISSVNSSFGIFIMATGGSATVSDNRIALSSAAVSLSTGPCGVYNVSANTTLTARNNVINLLQTNTGAGISGFSRGIYFLNSNGVTVTGCRITQNNLNTAANSSGAVTGIFSSATGNVSIGTDTITQTNAGATDADFNAILTSGNAQQEDLSNNVFMDCNVATSGKMSLINCGNVSATKRLLNNKTLGQTNHTSGPAAATYAIRCEGVGPGNTFLQVNSSLFSNITCGGPFYGLNYTPASAQNTTVFLQSNRFQNISAGAIVYGIRYAPPAGSSGPAEIRFNTIDTVSSSGGAVTGIYTLAGDTVTVLANTIANLSAPLNEVYGIYDAATQNAVAINRNKIYNLESGTAAAYGITVATGTRTAVSNNIIGNLRSSAGTGIADGVIGINLISGQPNSDIKVYYNTVYLAATSTGTNFSTAALFHLSDADPATATLDLRNNILVNNSTPNGSGTAVAFRRSGSSLGNYAAVSDRNLLYAGTPAATHLLYADGTNNYQTIGAYRAGLSPAESGSVTENPSFASTAGEDAAFLHFAAGTPTLAESRGIIIAGYDIDFEQQARYGAAGYSGSGTAPDLGAHEGEFTGSVVAIRLGDFNGRKTATGNELTWNTLSEGGASHFELQRSTNGTAFSKIATITAHGSAFSYRHSDALPAAGNNYYRLRTLNMDGSFTHSRIVLLTGKAQHELLLSATNPVHDLLTLQLSAAAEGTTIQLTDAGGRLLKEIKVRGTVVQMDMSSYAAGLYVVRCVKGEVIESIGVLRK